MTRTLNLDNLQAPEKNSNDVCSVFLLEHGFTFVLMIHLLLSRRSSPFALGTLPPIRVMPALSTDEQSHSAPACSGSRATSSPRSRKVSPDGRHHDSDRRGRLWSPNEERAVGSDPVQAR